MQYAEAHHLNDLNDRVGVSFYYYSIRVAITLIPR